MARGIVKGLDLVLSEEEYERFWSKVEAVPDSSCWLWMSTLHPAGYGAVTIRGVSYRAHRVAYVLHIGAIPDGMFVCHRCDTPRCVRPSHLFVGTPQENMTDSKKKGRKRKLSLAVVEEIRRCVSSPMVNHTALARRLRVARSTVIEYARGRR